MTHSEASHLPESAMRQAIGGEEAEPYTAAQLLADIEAVSINNAMDSYNDAALFAAKLILTWLLEDPQRAQSPAENDYALDDEGRMKWVDDDGNPTDYGHGRAVVREYGWYDRMKADGYELATLGLSGFQWGWAVNAARRCVELPAVPNPAIILVGGDDD